MIIPLDGDKTLDKIYHPFMIKVLDRLKIQQTCPTIMNAVYSKPIANSHLN